MNKTKNILIAAILLGALFMGWPAHGQAIKEGYVSYSTNAVTNTYVIAPAADNQKIRLVNLQVTNNATGLSGAMCFRGGTKYVRLIGGTATSSTNIVVSSATGYAPGDFVVVQRKTDDAGFFVPIGSTNSGTNIGFDVTVGLVLTNDDMCYLMGKVITNQVGAAAVSLQSESIFAAQLRMPLVVRLLNTNTANAVRVDNAVFKYDPYP